MFSVLLGHNYHLFFLAEIGLKLITLGTFCLRFRDAGRFHLLSNFDEGKRSCRRKLEKHNNRRRRKSNESKGGTDKEPQQVVVSDDVKEDDDRGKGMAVY